VVKAEENPKKLVERKGTMSAFLPLKENVSSKRSVDGTSLFLRNTNAKGGDATSNGNYEVSGFAFHAIGKNQIRRESNLEGDNQLIFTGNNPRHNNSPF
jgi:hypothetical protein